MTQLELRLSALKPKDLRAMLDAGLLRATGQTADGKVQCYELTHLGRMMVERAPEWWGYPTVREPSLYPMGRPLAAHYPTAGNLEACDLNGPGGSGGEL